MPTLDLIGEIVVVLRKRAQAVLKASPVQVPLREQPMITVNKFGTFWIVYCAECAWRSDPAGSWQEAEAFRFSHVCPLEPVLRIEYVPHFAAERVAV